MAPRATQASQARRGGPSQSQRRRGADSDDDDEEEYGGMDYDDDEDDERNVAGASQARVGSQSQADGANKKRAGGTGGLGPEVSHPRLASSVKLRCQTPVGNQTSRQ